MEQERASKKQQELLKFVDGFIKGNGYGPSYREIMRALGYKSVSAVAVHIDGLIAKGYLHRRDKSARSLEVVSTTSSSKQATETPSLQDQLKDLIAKYELTDEQNRTVKDALKLIGVELNDEDTK